MVAVATAAMEVKVHDTDWDGAAQTPEVSALTAVTKRRGSTVSVATTLVAVEEVPVFFTLIVKVCPVVPATTESSAKALVTSSPASLVIATVSEPVWGVVTSVEVAEPVLDTDAAAWLFAATD